MIEAKKQELKKSFKVHYSKYKEKLNDSTTNTTKSEKLILFYAIECGTKALLLEKIRKNSTRSFKDIVSIKKN